MSDLNKRKAALEDHRDDRSGKRSKGRSGGKWQTPHQQTKAAMAQHHGSGKIEPGDMGIWATCVKGKEGAATEELKILFEEYAEHLYGIADGGVELAVEQNAEEDIESSIQKEVNLMTSKQGSTKSFTPVYLDLQCVLFFKTRPPVMPVDFVHKICKDARNLVTKKMVRFVNRLTPVTMMAKATEKGLDDLGRQVLQEHFQLAYEKNDVDPKIDGEAASYAIRPTIRNHNTLKRDLVINLVASLISPKHKVDLTKPEKVIIVEIYQTICGMSVVRGDWENLKRYNLTEIYRQTSIPMADIGGKKEAQANPGGVSKDEPLVGS